MQKFLCAAALTLGFMAQMNAQFVVKINDKPITEGQTFQASDVTKMTVSYSNLKKISKYPLGRLTFLVDFIDAEGRAPLSYSISKKGTNAINAFLADATGNFSVLQRDNADSDFELYVGGYKNTEGFSKSIESAGENARSRTLKVKVSLYFQDDTGYEKYGDKVDLVKPVKFNVNTCNADGSMTIINSGGIRIAADVIDGVNYFSSFKTEKFFKLKNEYIEHLDVAHVCLKKADREYDRVYIHRIDTKGKTQDEVMNGFKAKMELFLLRMANACNPSLQKKIVVMTDEEENGWLQFLSDETYALLPPSLNKEENKAYDKEKIFQPVTLGQLSGFKYSSVFRNSFCKDAVAKRPIVSHASVFITKNPKNAKEVLVIFNYGADRSETAETAKAVSDNVDKFIAGLQF